MRLRLFAHALLFTLLINAPELLEVIRFHGLSPRSFSDWDEPYYFPLAVERGRHLLSLLFGADRAELSLRAILSPAPHDLFADGVGIFADVFHLLATTVGLGLDLVIAFVSFILFALFFESLNRNRARAEMAAFVILFFPWLFYLPQFVHIPLNLGAAVGSVAHVGYPCQPVVRGISTQLSYPFFAGALYAASRGRKHSPWLLLSGLLAGLCVYAYFFAWPATVTVVTLFLLLQPTSFKTNLTAIALFLFGAAISSAPALYVLMPDAIPAAIVANASSISIPEEVWYFSAEQFLLLAALCVVFFRRKNSVLALAVAALVSEFLLMNIQAVTRHAIAPYHFPLLFLTPLLSGCLFDQLSAVFRKQIFRKIIYTALIAFAAAISVQRIFEDLKMTGATKEFTELAVQIEKKTDPDSVLMFAPSDHPFESGKQNYHFFSVPYWINALTARPLFANFVGQSSDFLMEKDLEIGWIYSGTLQPFVPCPKNLPELPGDILSGMMTREYWQRYYTCQELPALLSSESLCQIIGKNRFDFVVWQRGVVSVSPQASLKYLDPVWQSASGEYQLLRFNRDAALKTLCEQPAQSAALETPSNQSFE